MNARLFLPLLAALVLGNPPALAAPPTVEIIAMPHPPVIRALKPLRDWLAAQGARVQVRELDAESPQGARRLADMGLTGHIPVALLIDGSPDYQRKDGRRVRFVLFPATPDSPPGARGEWLIEDARAAIQARMGRP